MRAMGCRIGSLATACLLGGALSMLGGCSTAGVVLGAAGIATDTSVSWEIVKHLHAKATEGDDVPCARLDSVQRALNVRCGPFVPGSVSATDLQRSKLQACVLGVATSDPRFWPALPEFIAKGASPAACARSPLVELAQSRSAQAGCVDFSTTSPAERQAILQLATADPRAVHHDVMRMLSCPSAVAAGLDDALVAWLASGELAPRQVAFGPFGALHPDYLDSPFAHALEAQGHTARAGLGGFDGAAPQGFELALRDSQWAALEWWFARVPELANRVPPTQGNQLPWVPLQRVLTPGFLAHADSQTGMVEFLLARGADPRQKLPFDSSLSVVQFARNLRSPQLSLLDPPVVPTLIAGSDAKAVDAPRR